ncbi:FecR family protein [Chitinophagaceae bacterium LWZ2-11]
MNEFNDIAFAEQLMIDKLTGQIAAKENFKLESLIRDNPEVKQLWDDLLRVYVGNAAVEFEKTYNEERSWQTLQEKYNKAIQAEQPPAKVTSIFNNKWFKYGIAAAIIAAISIGAIKYLQKDTEKGSIVSSAQLKLANGKIIELKNELALTDNNSQAIFDLNANTANSLNVLSVPIAKDYKIKLVDGTEIYLDAVSALSFPLAFDATQRNVSLIGEAYFKVAHNKDVPFVINVNGIKVTVLGTEFNIRAYPGETSQIALIRGKVSVENKKGETVILAPGQTASITKNNDQINIDSSPDEAMVKSWMKGVYNFRNEDLTNIIAMTERWFNVKIKLNDPSLTGLQFTGALNKNKPITVFMNSLSGSADIKYEVQQDSVILLKR